MYLSVSAPHFPPPAFISRTRFALKPLPHLNNGLSDGCEVQGLSAWVVGHASKGPGLEIEAGPVCGECHATGQARPGIMTQRIAAACTAVIAAASGAMQGNQATCLCSLLQQGTQPEASKPIHKRQSPGCAIEHGEG